MAKIRNLTRIPDDVKVFAKYMNEGKVFYSRCYFIAVFENGFAQFMEFDCEESITNPEIAGNFVGFEVIDEYGWIPAEEFCRKYKPDEYRKFMECR